MTEKKKKPRFIKPPNKLKAKVGGGGFDEKLVVKSQEHIDKPKMDFLPYAQKFLQDFSALVEEASKSEENFRTLREKLVRPVMQLKANGGMFQYPLITEVADIALQFLEDINLDNINSETFEILRAHENALKMIVSRNLKGDDRPEGAILLKELNRASERYFSKYKE